MDALGKNSENSLESGEIEGQDKLKDQEEKRIINYVESINIDAVKRKSKIDIKRVLEKTTNTWYFNSNDALNNLLDDSKGGFAQVIFTTACCTHIWRSPAARQENHILPHN